MTDDWEMYQGEDATPYFAITSDGTSSGTPVDLTAWSAATWVAFTVSGTTVTPVITKHQSDMVLGVDPDVSEASVENTIFVHLIPVNTGVLSDLGQFRHEIRITLDGLQSVVYPQITSVAGAWVVPIATFSVILSGTWNPLSTPPAPRADEDKTETRYIRVPQARIDTEQPTIRNAAYNRTTH